MDLLLTGRLMDAHEAERAGLVSRVVSSDRLRDEVLSAARTISTMSLPSVMAMKECVDRAFESSLSEGVVFERRQFLALFGTRDQKDGMAAFLEKRAPQFAHE
jgi:enoyl-CoA hydratase